MSDWRDIDSDGSVSGGEKLFVLGIGVLCVLVIVFALLLTVAINQLIHQAGC